MEGTTIRRDGESNRIAAGGTAGEGEEGLEGKDLGFPPIWGFGGDLKLVHLATSFYFILISVIIILKLYKNKIKF